MKKTALILALALLISLAGCGGASGAENLAVGSGPSGGELSSEAADAVTDFSLRLLSAAGTEGENTLLSPLSVLFALGMTANGAEGETLAQMEEAFGLDIASLNEALAAVAGSMSSQALTANSIWINDTEEFTPDEDFLALCGEYYDAGVFAEPFDSSTAEEINAFVSEHTNGLIEKIIDEIPENAVMYLVNAMSFDADWENIYREDQVREGTFTTAEGEEQAAEFMHSEEWAYLEGDGFTGFMKPYEGGDYAFAALLPEEGSSPAELISSLNGAELRALLASPQDVNVDTALPKFESGSSLELSETLEAMGMADAFDPEFSDFSALGQSAMGNIYINRVLHETFISVDEKGTEAGAATAVEMVAEGAPAETRAVRLDRPFAYMIVDTATGVPLFMGFTQSMNT